MSAFADALDVLFLDANLSVEIWHRDSEGQFTRARGIDCGPTRAPLAPKVADADERMRDLVSRPSILEWIA